MKKKAIENPSENLVAAHMPDIGRDGDMAGHTRGMFA
jgi:hypothetical protein